MTLTEALKKYGIPVPDNIYDYDKEKYSEFDNMYLKSFYDTFYTAGRNNKSVGDGKKIAVVLGGQTGAGKSALVAETKREFEKNGRRIVLIDDDSYRSLYPYGEEILKECPEHYTNITATATRYITPKILKFASENGYNFIFDGTMKNPRIVETMRSWKEYSIQAKIMATCRLQSLMGIAIRNGELRRLGREGRYISIEAHDETYKGIPDTLKLLEATGLAEEIKIYTRGADPIYPIERFSSLMEPEKSSGDKLIELREDDERVFLKNIEQDLQYLKSLSSSLSEEERESANKIIEMIKERKEITGKIGKGEK